MRTQPEEAPVIFIINHYHHLKKNFFPAVGEILTYLQHFTFLCFRRIQYIPILFYIQPSFQFFVLRSKEKPIHSKLQFLFGRQPSPVAVTTFPEDFPDFFNVLAKPTHTYVGSQFGHCDSQFVKSR